MSRLLGIDYGLERTGLAVTDPGGSLVFPLMTMHFRNFHNRGEFFDELARKIQTEGITACVWGLPQNMDGSENLMCAQVRNAAKRLGRRINIETCFMPEILSSFEAEEDLRKLGLTGKKLKEALDQQAACRILQSFLNQKPTPHI